MSASATATWPLRATSQRSITPASGITAAAESRLHSTLTRAIGRQQLTQFAQRHHQATRRRLVPIGRPLRSCPEVPTGPAAPGPRIR